jgi:hypothetical protein
MMIPPFEAHAAAVRDFRSTMQGRVITPFDEGYEEGRSATVRSMHNPERLTAFGQ